ncbi:MAG: DNA-processing protein DprA [Tannerellaceae bacterium]|jgi:DNA processing protein|nr:DNA-processing protein DprA [Tannerellaceae bacterium]
MNNQLIYQIALTMIEGVGDVLGRNLLENFGSAEDVFAAKASALEKVQGIGHALSAKIKHPDVLRRAEEELSFIDKNNISCYFMPDKNYPSLLRECGDAPLLIYFKGKCDLNSSKIISIVGTRKPTDYGRSMTEKLIAELAQSLPDLVVVSGLAYGIDITAHRSALKRQLPTVAVLAHGLDRLYPLTHHSIAAEMLEHGGLLTEFPSGTNPDKMNFVRRNRLIAGLSSATVVVESAERGGSLITSGIAFSYNRDVFAFPGRSIDPSSQGCNRIISENQAKLITHASDIIRCMNWEIDAKEVKKPQQAVQTELFLDHGPAPQVLALIRKKGKMHLNQIAAELNIHVKDLMSVLTNLEIDGKISSMPGNTYNIR